MSYAKKLVAMLLCCYMTAGVLLPFVEAKSFGSSSSSGGGRSSFSTSSKSFSSGSSGGSGSSSTVRSKTADSSGSVESKPSGQSLGKGYTSDKSDFSTPRDASPPSLSKDYQTETKDFSSGKNAFQTEKKSYNGTWDRAVDKKEDNFPDKPAVQVYGSPPNNAYHYHNYYWSSPPWYTWFFHPYYHYTPWGFGYYEPNFFSWFLSAAAIAGLIYAVYWFVMRRKG